MSYYKRENHLYVFPFLSPRFPPPLRPSLSPSLSHSLSFLRWKMFSMKVRTEVTATNAAHYFNSNWDLRFLLLQEVWLNELTDSGRSGWNVIIMTVSMVLLSDVHLQDHPQNMRAQFSWIITNWIIRRLKICILMAAHNQLAVQIITAF